MLPVKNLLKSGGEVVCLIKPQFEAGREKVGKKGVVRDKSVHEEVIEMVLNYAISIGYDILGLSFPQSKDRKVISNIWHILRKLIMKQALLLTV